ncbi:MAG: protein kinase [Verrucomicrobiota bacterium]
MIEPSQLGFALGSQYQVQSLIYGETNDSVFQAIHMPTGRWTAVRVVAADPSSIEKISRAPAQCQMLKHPNIVEILDCGQISSGYLYFATEWMHGNLQQLLDAGPADPVYGLNVLKQICTGLEFAHSLGYVHGGLSPVTVFLSAEGVPKIEHPVLADLTPRRPEAKSYAPLENIHVEGPNNGVDVYSAVALYYHLVAGSIPIRSSPEPLCRLVEIDPGLGHVIDRALAFKPELRIGSAVELQLALNAAEQGQQIPEGIQGAKPVGPAAQTPKWSSTPTPPEPAPPPPPRSARKSVRRRTGSANQLSGVLDWPFFWPAIGVVSFLLTILVTLVVGGFFRSPGPGPDLAVVPPTPIVDPAPTDSQLPTTPEPTPEPEPTPAESPPSEPLKIEPRLVTFQLEDPRENPEAPIRSTGVVVGAKNSNRIVAVSLSSRMKGANSLYNYSASRNGASPSESQMTVYREDPRLGIGLAQWRKNNQPRSSLTRMPVVNRESLETATLVWTELEENPRSASKTRQEELQDEKERLKEELSKANSDLKPYTREAVELSKRRQFISKEKKEAASEIAQRLHSLRNEFRVVEEQLQSVRSSQLSWKVTQKTVDPNDESAVMEILDGLKARTRSVLLIGAHGLAGVYSIPEETTAKPRFVSGADVMRFFDGYFGKPMLYLTGQGESVHLTVKADLQYGANWSNSSINVFRSSEAEVQLGANQLESSVKPESNRFEEDDDSHLRVARVTLPMEGQEGTFQFFGQIEAKSFDGAITYFEPFKFEVVRLGNRLELKLDEASKEYATYYDPRIEQGDQESRTRQLPIDGRIVGSWRAAGGDLLCVQLADPPAIRFLDIAKSEWLDSPKIPIREDAIVTAGAAGVFVYYQDQQVLERWNLATGERVSRILKDQVDVAGMAAPALNAKAPLFMVSAGRRTFIDPETLRAWPPDPWSYSKARGFDVDLVSLAQSTRYIPTLKAAGDGSSYLVSYYHRRDRVVAASFALRPSTGSDGRNFYRINSTFFDLGANDAQLFTENRIHSIGDQGKLSILSASRIISDPCRSGILLGFESVPGRQIPRIPGSLTIIGHGEHDSEPTWNCQELAKLEVIDNVASNTEPPLSGEPVRPPEASLHLCIDQEAVVVISPDGDAISVTHVDFQQLLAEKWEGPSVVLSPLPRTLVINDTLRQPLIAAVPGIANPQITLIEGPEGARIASGDVLEWDSSGFEGVNAEFVLAVQSGEPQSFSISMIAPGNSVDRAEIMRDGQEEPTGFLSLGRTIPLRASPSEAMLAAGGSVLVVSYSRPAKIDVIDLREELIRYSLNLRHPDVRMTANLEHIYLFSKEAGEIERIRISDPDDRKNVGVKGNLVGIGTGASSVTYPLVTLEKVDAQILTERRFEGFTYRTATEAVGILEMRDPVTLGPILVSFGEDIDRFAASAVREWDQPWRVPVSDSGRYVKIGSGILDLDRKLGPDLNIGYVSIDKAEDASVSDTGDWVGWRGHRYSLNLPGSRYSSNFVHYGGMSSRLTAVVPIPRVSEFSCYLAVEDEGYPGKLEFHKLKGTGTTYGVPEVTELCEKMETLCRNRTEIEEPFFLIRTP